MEKLDKWADDVKSSIELELKELDREIKARKTEAKKILKLDEKVKAKTLKTCGSFIICTLPGFRRQCLRNQRQRLVYPQCPVISHATEFTSTAGGKPWKYILVPHNAVLVNMSFDTLVRKYEDQEPYGSVAL